MATSVHAQDANSKTTVTVTAANCDTASPCYVIKSSAQVLTQAINQELSERQTMTMIESSITPQIDFVLMTRLAMGSNWKTASPAQQTKIVSLFKQMLVSSYSTALSRFKGAQVTINNSSIIGDKQNKAIVTSTIALPSNGNSNNQPVNLEYDLAKINGSWKIYDVKIENASIVTTYRSQFNDVIKDNGISGLIDQLQSKVEANKKQ
jgi:phospholipid transport system substrate-binding protein